MTVIVFSRKDCGLCDALKDKLKRVFEVEYTERDIDESLAPGDHWRETDVDRVRSMHCLINEKIPMTVIDEVPYDYIGALRVLKRLTHPDSKDLPGVDWEPKKPGEQHETKPVEPLPNPFLPRETPKQDPYPAEGPPLTFEESLRDLQVVCMGMVEHVGMNPRWVLDHGSVELMANAMTIRLRGTSPVRFQEMHVAGTNLREMVGIAQREYLRLRHDGQI